jgi:disulfide bond formation protein DsbB
MGTGKIVTYIAFFQALLATLGSLYFSEIAGFPPCILCWYQRICMYPIAAILTVGILRKDKNVPYYVLPFSLAGLAIAFYHNLLYYNILPESAAPCTLGISCTTKFIEWFGFVTIPFLSTMAFAIVTTCMVILLKQKKS